MSVITRVLKTTAIATLVAAAAVTAVDAAPQATSPAALSASPVAATSSSVNGSITRSEVVSRAQYWVDQQVPYSQGAVAPDSLGRNYRTDCSGLVSLAWHLGTSLTTYSLPQVSTKLSGLDDLQPGDALNNIDAHVVLFTGWTDASHTVANIIEQPKPGLTARKNTYTRSYINSAGFKPYRYNKIIEGTPTAPDAGMTDLTGGNFGGSTAADVIAVESASGKLFYYPGTSGGQLGARVQVGSNWGSMSELSSGKFTSDAHRDIAAVDADGKLWIYPGNGDGTFGNRIQAGTGWDSMHDLAGADVNKDGKTDLLAVGSDGKLFAYPGNGNGGFNDRVQIGSGWNAMNDIVSPGDLDNDGKDDIVAREVSTGNLYAYPGTGTFNGMNTLGTRVQIGSGWNAMTNLVSGDFNNDGIGDVDAVEASNGDTGKFYSYPGTGTLNGMNTLGTRVQIGSGW
ncbi:FG-GAP-like repeat-containing protein [Streptomyces sp. NPDC057939]|uniref:C40 family peptidase n=1 Tax=Streptomyces sp. NPDC057939 TaxID=3346284 RepID=UPI0036E4407B